MSRNNFSAGKEVSSPNQGSMPNVIFLIGDGMGPEQIRAASLVEYGIEFGTIMDTDFPFQTYFGTNDSNNELTDSAASGTALATGRKTTYGTISMDPEGKIKYKTILEYLKQDFDYKVGIVTTTEVAHATPGVFASHSRTRDYEANMFQEMLSKDLNVLMAGGLSISYIKNATNARKIGSDNGFDVATNRQELLNLNGTSDKILAIFEKYDMPYEYDRNPDVTPSLREMTNIAINTLDSDDTSFFLMAEGGRIDHAGHENHFGDEQLQLFNNKTVRNIVETLMFEETVRDVLDFAKRDGNTIVAVMADHETGGLQVLDFTNLDDILPNESNSRAENLEIRERRALQLNVLWETISHTPADVKFFGYGAAFDKYEITENDDIFWAVNAELGKFAVVYEQSSSAVEGLVKVDYIIRDLDETATSIEIQLDTKVGSELINSEVKTFNLSFANTFAFVSLDYELQEGQVLAYSANVIEQDNSKISSLPAIERYSKTEEVNSEEAINDETPISYLYIPLALLSLTILRKKLKFHGV